MEESALLVKVNSCQGTIRGTHPHSQHVREELHERAEHEHASAPELGPRETRDESGDGPASKGRGKEDGDGAGGNIVGTKDIGNQGAETAIVDAGGEEGEGGAGELDLEEGG